MPMNVTRSIRTTAVKRVWSMRSVILPTMTGSCEDVDGQQPKMYCNAIM